VILCDLYSAHWTIQPRPHTAKGTARDPFEFALRARGLADFLRSQPGLFRVHFEADVHPNLGDLWGIQTTASTMATELQDFERFRNTVPYAMEMLNVRYIIRPGTAAEPGEVYKDQEWKVYPLAGYPRAWMVEQAVTDSAAGVWERLRRPGFNPLRLAILSDSLESELPPHTRSEDEEIRFDAYRPNRIELTVRTRSAGLLVMSESYYPGWRAAVNGARTPIHKADGVFRSVLVPAGESRVVFTYAPVSVILGGAVTVFALLASVVACVMGCNKAGV
jgi:hypothetical protein